MQLKTIEEGLLEINFMQITLDIYWKHILSVINIELNQTDRFQTEKDELIKIKNTLRKQLNQLQPNIKTDSKVKKSAKWLKSNKNKNRSHENVSTDK